MMVVLAAAITAYLVVDALIPGTNAGVKWAYLLFAVVLFFGSGRALSQTDGHLKLPVPLFVWTAFGVAHLASASLNYPEWSLDMITDAIIVIVPALLYLITCRWSERTRRELVVYVTFAAVVAGVIADWATDVGRFDPPSLIALTASWVFAVAPPSWLSRESSHPTWFRVAGFTGLVITLASAVGSQNRTVILLWIAIGMVCIGAAIVRRWRLMGGSPRVALEVLAAICALVVTQPLLMSTPLSAVPDMLSTVRMQDLASGKLDDSILNRLLEAQDVLHTMQMEGNPATHLVGFGHGSSYVPQVSFLEKNVDEVSGRVHNIHIVPILILFRYGIVGLGLFAWTLIAGLLNALRSFRTAATCYSAIVLLTWAAYSMDLLVRNSLPQPVFALALALALLPSRMASR